LAFVWQEGSLREVSQRFAPIALSGQKIQIRELVISLSSSSHFALMENSKMVKPDRWRRDLSGELTPSRCRLAAYAHVSAHKFFAALRFAAATKTYCGHGPRT
jgi:hypothetical protein